MTLGKAAKLLGTSRNTLRVLLKHEKEHGFTVLEKIDANGRVWRYLETISIGGVELDSVPDAGPDEHTRELEQTGVVLRLHLVPRLDSPVFR